MKDNSKTHKNKVSVLKDTQLDRLMSGSTEKTDQMAKGNIFGQMVTITKVSLLTI